MRDGKAKRPSVCTRRVEFGPFVPAVPAHVSRTTTLPLARADTLRPSASACLDTDLAIRPIQLGWKYQKTGPPFSTSNASDRLWRKAAVHFQRHLLVDKHELEMDSVYK